MRSDSDAKLAGLVVIKILVPEFKMADILRVTFLPTKNDLSTLTTVVFDSQDAHVASPKATWLP